jgi:hypothetical protein
MSPGLARREFLAFGWFPFFHPDRQREMLRWLEWNVA